MKTITLPYNTKVRILKDGSVHSQDQKKVVFAYSQKAESMNDSMAFVGPNCRTYQYWKSQYELYRGLSEQANIEFKIF